MHRNPYIDITKMKTLSSIVLLSFLLSATSQSTLAQTKDTTTAVDETAESALSKLQDNQAELSAKQDELAELDKKIKALSQKHETASNEAELAADQLAYISQQLNAAQLQYDQTLLSITVIREEISQSEEQSVVIQADIADLRLRLKEALRSLYQHERTSFLDVILGSSNLGALLSERRTYRELQQRALEQADKLHARQQDLSQHIGDLEKQQQQMQQLKELQAYQQADLSTQKTDKNNFLKLKQTDQAQYAREIATTKQTRAEIEQDLFSLQGIGVELALNDAYQSARFASSVTGVRPSLLLGIVKVETNVGESLGSGTFPDDMHPASREAFLRLTEKLQLDPHNTPISRRPASYQGWGGAIGPGQFMPDTWERLSSRVSDLMKKPTPDPFTLTDSLVAVGIMLADRGATDPAKEIEAIGRYIAGPNWQYHLWYSTRVLAVAAEYEKEGLK